MHHLHTWLAIAWIALTTAAPAAQPSALWGTSGENWSPTNRLPDFSRAGYHCGEDPIPDLPQGRSVKEFGAKGDGVTDDSDAFLKAIAGVERGAIEVPPGRYKITKILEIRRSGVVLRGAGPGKSVLVFPIPLNDIRPDWGATTTGQRTSNYSWSGGFVWIRGRVAGKNVTGISAAVIRGEQTVPVDSTSGLRVGQRILIAQDDQPDNSLAAEIYSGDPGTTSKLHGSTRMRQACRITTISDGNVSLDRPLRFALDPRWKPRIVDFAPEVTESGVESLCFEFPNTPYKGHFTELGFNAVAMTGCSDCWARNLRIANSDSGVYATGFFCTVADIVLESDRAPARDGSTGHHGVCLGQDCLLTGFDFRTEFIHDITVDGGATGNVARKGKAVDLSCDGHKRACGENLFSDIDAGKGTHLWRHGGGADLGKAFAARSTWWNIRTARPQVYPPADFGPPSMNFVAITTQQPTTTNLAGKWFEAIPPDSIAPRDIYEAQRNRRMAK